jgi:flagellar protein FlaF
VTAQLQAQRAYSAASAHTRTPRNLEYDAVARITHRLKSADKKGGEEFPTLVEALHENRKMWNIFAADVADTANKLPQELKAKIFYLAEFTSQHTSKVLARQANVAPLLEINTAILHGLRSGAA